MTKIARMKTGFRLILPRSQKAAIIKKNGTNTIMKNVRIVRVLSIVVEILFILGIIKKTNLICV